MATIQTLARWIDENGYRSIGYARELALEYPDDPGQRITELQVPITPA
jgi:effector-binding domain-containing protein